MGRRRRGDFDRCISELTRESIEQSLAEIAVEFGRRYGPATLKDKSNG